VAVLNSFDDIRNNYNDLYFLEQPVCLIGRSPPHLPGTDTITLP
jgi:hypothetical protein